MTRFQRRMVIGLSVILLLLTGIGALAYKFYLSPTSYALQRAEAFLFRRMQVVRLSHEGEYRFFFITNRELEKADGPLEDSFGTRRVDELKYGYFDVRIEPALGLGMLINPTEWFQNEEIKLKAVRELDKEDFTEQLRTIVGTSPQRSLLVVVHGFREAFPSALRKTTFISHVLDINSPVLLFDWPGNQGSSPSGYRRAQQLAKESANDLAGSMELTIQNIRPERLWLIANSMGAQVAVDALRLLVGQTGPNEKQSKIEDVILTAPDIDYDEFDEAFQAALEALVQRTTIYVSSNDRALLASRILNRTPRRGESTLDPRLSQTTLQVIDHDPNADRITIVDVTPVNRTRNFHNFSLETPEFFDDLFLRLTNTEIPHSRLIYPVEAPHGAIYWILTRGR
ncbi:alpha/beta hydrolase [Desulfonatronum thioautotrophicum]|uniref:alpha/beta hydrolase n=1 Tax=Desulfonatronum thioautotrophicum TaxID=617001 RepID=UPI0005EBD13C|nr:alpha/beta fold hydrolase [Desulfonatronum thioautotrophicum]